LENYLKKEVLRNRDAKIEENDDLIGEGILDSIGIFQIVVFIETTFNIQVPDDDVVYENFHSLSTMVDYLKTHSST
jgi:acyl carrier protein